MSECVCVCVCARASSHACMHESMCMSVCVTGLQCACALRVGVHVCLLVIVCANVGA